MANPNFTSQGIDPNAQLAIQGFSSLGGLAQAMEQRRQEGERKAPASEAKQAYIKHLTDILNSGHPQAAEYASHLLQHPGAMEASMRGAHPDEIAAHIHVGNMLKQGGAGQAAGEMGQGPEAQAETNTGVQNYVQAANGLSAPTAPNPDAYSQPETQPRPQINLGKVSNEDFDTLAPMLGGLASRQSTDVDRAHLALLKNQNALTLEQLKQTNRSANIATTEEGKNNRAGLGRTSREGIAASHDQTQRDIAAGRNQTQLQTAGMRAQAQREAANIRAQAQQAKSIKSPQEKLHALMKLRTTATGNVAYSALPDLQETVKQIDAEISALKGGVAEPAPAGDKQIKDVQRNPQTGQTRTVYTDGTVEVH